MWNLTGVEAFSLFAAVLTIAVVFILARMGDTAPRGMN